MYKIPNGPKVSYESAMQGPGGVFSYLVGYLTTLSENIIVTNERPIHEEMERIWKETLVP